MDIQNLRPSGAGSGAVATFDIEVVPGLRLTGWHLRRSDRGEWRTFPPSPRHGTPAAITAPDVREKITAAAAAIYTGGQRPDDNSN